MEINNKEQTYIEYGYTTAQEMESFDHSDGESSTDSNVDDSDWKPIWLNYDSIAYSKYLPYT